VKEKLSMLRLATRYLLVLALVAIPGCKPEAPIQKQATEAHVTEPQLIEPQLVEPQPLPAPEPEKVTDPASGKMAWAEKFEGQFIAGLDGWLYLPYKSITIRRTQQALVDRGLYEGPVNGVLDPPTMRAIYTFQKVTHMLQPCGIPTPRTRRMLAQGSHTDA
jgi:hypothetical protein